MDGAVYALSADDGDERWRFETDGSVWSSVAVADAWNSAASGRVYVAAQDDTQYALSDHHENTAPPPTPEPGSTESSPTGQRATETLPEEPAPEGPPVGYDWLERWAPLVAGVLAVPVVGPLVLGVLLAVLERRETAGSERAPRAVEPPLGKVTEGKDGECTDACDVQVNLRPDWL